MLGIDDAVASVSNTLTTAINKIWPNPEDKAKAEAIAITAAADAAVTQLKAAQAVMLAEEQSADPWTSRARPSFLYVIYTLILFAPLIGVVNIWHPEAVKATIDGFQGWLEAIPDSFIQLFGVGYLGYTGSRTIEKHLDLKAKIAGV